MRKAITWCLIFILWSCKKNSGDPGPDPPPTLPPTPNVSGNILIEWQKPFGGSGSDDGNAIAATSDGNYILAGRTNSTDGDATGNSSNGKGWIIKLTNTGTVAWQKALGENDAQANAIIETQDGGYALAGFNHAQIQNLWVAKLNSTGDIVWQKYLGGSDRDVSASIIATADGNFIVAGDTKSNDGDVSGSHGAYDFWVIKISNAGDIIWKKVFGGSDWDRACCVINANDGGYIVSGYTTSNDGDFSGNHGKIDGWIFKLSSDGDIVWQKIYGGNELDAIVSIISTANGYIICGNTTSFDGNFSANHGQGDAWIAKLNNSGEMIWQKVIGTVRDETAAAVTINPNGEIIVAGSSVYGSNGDFYIARLNKDGELLSQKTLGGNELDVAEGIINGSNGSYVAVGTSWSLDIAGHHGGVTDLLAIKFKFQQ